MQVAQSTFLPLELGSDTFFHLSPRFNLCECMVGYIHLHQGSATYAPQAVPNAKCLARQCLRPIHEHLAHGHFKQDLRLGIGDMSKNKILWNVEPRYCR